MMRFLERLPERVRTVVLYAPIPILLIVISLWSAFVMIAVILAIALLEWRGIVIKDEDRFNSKISRITVIGGVAAYALVILSPWLAIIAAVLLGAFVYVQELTKKMDLALGVVIPVLVGVSAFVLRELGVHYLFFAVVIAAFSDTAAYFVGRAFGRTPLAPSISPNKTIEGAIGGWIAAILGGFIYSAWFLPEFSALPFFFEAVIYLLLAMAGQAGDLSESALKREYGVKDSGTLLPGHGGVMDRFDALSFIVILLAFSTLFVG